MVRAYCWITILLLITATVFQFEEKAGVRNRTPGLPADFFRGDQLNPEGLQLDTISSLVENKTIHDVNNKLKIETRRNNNRDKKSLSTSSSSAAHKSSEGSAVSLGISSESSSESVADHRPKSSEQRKGWRKWHRKCSPCPEDMVKKWRDRSISWICGGYQRARRSFKSDCMMYYRNCQDGTMFVKLHDQRCKNDTDTGLRHGLHFFYEYGKDPDDSQASSSSDDSSLQHVSTDFSS